MKGGKGMELDLFLRLAVLGWLITAAPGAAAGGGFVRSRGGRLVTPEGGPFYADGFNAYWFMDVGSDPGRRDNVSTALRQAASLGLTVARTWAFSDGGGVPLQRSPGVYDERTFRGLDFAISEAQKHGIRLILSLVNNYEAYGGKKQYVAWAREAGQALASEDDFFTNSLTMTFYKNHIKKVITRNNSVNGVVYRDDPTILSWELMNEPRCPTDSSGKSLQRWIQEMASFVKSIDRNHLLEIGLEGFYGQATPQRQQYNPNPSSHEQGTDFISNNLIRDVDFVTVHAYPDQWLGNATSEETQLQFLDKWVSIHAIDAHETLKKPVMYTEFGKSKGDPGYTVAQRNRVFNTVLSAVDQSAKLGGPVAGGLFWQLLASGMDSYRDGNEVVVGENPSTDSLISSYRAKASVKESRGET